jgi:hypothetical protein
MSHHPPVSSPKSRDPTHHLRRSPNVVIACFSNLLFHLRNPAKSKNVSTLLHAPLCSPPLSSSTCGHRRSGGDSDGGGTVASHRDQPWGRKSPKRLAERALLGSVGQSAGQRDFPPHWSDKSHRGERGAARFAPKASEALRALRPRHRSRRGKVTPGTARPPEASARPQ